MLKSNNPPKAVIVGIKGLYLSDEERRLFAQHNPVGFILFGRNIQDPQQVRHLVAELKDAVGRADAPILIDQEGGRVARLKRPHFRNVPAAGKFAALAGYHRDAAKEAVYLNARLIAAELAGLGISVDCAPVVDLFVPGSHDIIGDRAYGSEPEQVALLARAMCQGLLDGGVMPVIKHIPGHGRAKADSHEALPVVDTDKHTLSATDFRAFALMADAPWAMTAHILYTALDNHSPATHSPAVIRMIREEIGFHGVLVSDDLSMKALQGSFAERTVRTLQAGCDMVLHCNADREEMEAILHTATPLSVEALERMEHAKRKLAPYADIDIAATQEKLDGLLGMGMA